MIKSALKLASGSLLGKFSGFGRELLLAFYYGTGAVASASRASQTATLVPVEFFAANTLSSAFLPIYAKLELQSKESASAFFWAVLVIILAISVALLVLLRIYSEEWVNVVAPGFSGESRRATIQLLGIMAVGIPSYMLGNLLSYLAMAKGDYSLASARATLQNVGMTAGVLLAWHVHSIAWIGWGFVGAYMVYCCWGIGTAVRQKWAPLPHCDWRLFSVPLSQFWRGVKPLLLLPVVLQMSVVIERAVASLISDSTVASLGYAKLITETGVLLIAMPLGLVGLATMGNMSEQEFVASLKSVCKPVFLITIPATFILALHSEFIVRVLFEHGSFDESSTTTTSVLLSSMAWGLWAQVIGYFLVKALSARFRNKEVLLFMSMSLIVQACLNIFLHNYLGPSALGVSASVSAVVLFILTARTLSVLGELMRYLSPLLLIAAFHVIIVFVLSTFGVHSDELLGILLSFIYWFGCLMLIKDFRALLMGVFIGFRRKSNG